MDIFNFKIRFIYLIIFCSGNNNVSTKPSAMYDVSYVNIGVCDVCTSLTSYTFLLLFRILR